MNKNVVTTEQLWYQRLVAERIEFARRRWHNRCRWYPDKQESIYRRCGEIYQESRVLYGDKNFNHYAKRNRLLPRYNTASDADINLKERSLLTSPVAYLKDYKPPLTTSGVYGYLPRTDLYYC